MDKTQAIAQARQLARLAKDNGHPVAFEVVARNNGRGPIEVQPFGMSALFKSHKVLHVEPIPKD